MTACKDIVFNNEKDDFSHGAYNVPGTILLCKILITRL